MRTISSLLAFFLFFQSGGVFAQSFQPLDPVLDPLNYGVAADAIEVPELRTEKTITFRLSNGTYVAVGVEIPLFTHDQYGNFVPIDESGHQTARAVVFDRLPRDAIVTFDASSPGYTYQLGKHWLKLRYAGRAEVIFKAPNVVTYRLSDSAVLTFTVRGATVQKEITITGNVDPAVLQFSLTADPELSVRSSKDGMQLREKDGTVIFQTSAPILQDTTGKTLNHPISIVSLGSGNFTYHYDQAGLPETYVIDPTAGLRSPVTCADATGIGTVAWSVTGCSATATLFESVSHYFKATNFGFYVPQAATVTGIVAKATKSGGSIQTNDQSYRLVKAGTIQSGAPAYSATQGGVFITFGQWSGGEYTYGKNDDANGAQTDDLWSGTWTSTDINNSGFGFAIAATTLAEPDTTVNIAISGVKMKVYFTVDPSSCKFGETPSVCDDQEDNGAICCLSNPDGCYQFCDAVINTCNSIVIDTAGISAVDATDETIDMTQSANFFGTRLIRFKKDSTYIADLGFKFGYGPACPCHVTADTDKDHKSFFHLVRQVCSNWPISDLTIEKLLSESGPTNSGFTLYVPKSVSHDRVRVCSGATVLGCTSSDNWHCLFNDQSQLFSTNNGFDATGITTTIADGYWKIHGLHGTGGEGESSGSGGTAVPEFPLVGLVVVLAGCLVFMRWKVLRRD